MSESFVVDKSKRSIEEIKVVSQGYFTDVTTEIANELNKFTDELGDEIKVVENLNKEIEAIKKENKVIIDLVCCC